jgi:GST-like protein
MSLQLFTAATPNGWKVSIMLEELVEEGVLAPDFAVHTVDLFAGEQFSAAFTAVNPNQKIPALLDGDIALMESCAILQYLAERCQSRLLPAGAGRWQALQWLYWQAANVGPVFGNKLSYTRYLEDVPAEQKAHPLERFRAEAQRLVGVLETQLADGDFVCGEHYTIADIALYPWLRGWKWSKVDISDRPHILAWLDRVRARPAVERGLLYGSNREEVDQWSEQRKRDYAAAGAKIAANRELPE